MYSEFWSKIDSNTRNVHNKPDITSWSDVLLLQENVRKQGKDSNENQDITMTDTENVLKYKCNICNLELKRKDTMVNHNSTVHNSIQFVHIRGKRIFYHTKNNNFYP